MPKQNAGVWRLWDAFRMADSEMLGWWSKDCPVRTNEPRVVATAYLHRRRRALIVVGSWLRHSWQGHLHLNWTLLGMSPNRARIEVLDPRGAVKRSLEPESLERLVIPAQDGLLLRIASLVNRTQRNTDLWKVRGAS